MTATISKWGNSQGLRLPKEIIKNLHLHIGDKVNILIEGEKVIIEPIKKHKVSLEELVSKIPKEYQGKEEFSSTQGKEEW